MQTRSDELKQNLKYQFPLLLRQTGQGRGCGEPGVRDVGQETGHHTSDTDSKPLDPLFPRQAWSECWAI